jgi:GxxExxY protein
MMVISRLLVAIFSGFSGFQRKMDHTEFLHFDVTGKVIGAVHRVYGKLGGGLPRDLYQNALTHDLTQNNSQVSRSHAIAVSYDDAVVGEWPADLLVDERVIIVVTADKHFDSALEMTLLNILKASEFEVGIVVNFGDKLEFRRKVCSNTFKGRKSSSDAAIDI